MATDKQKLNFKSTKKSFKPSVDLFNVYQYVSDNLFEKDYAKIAHETGVQKSQVDKVLRKEITHQRVMDLAFDLAIQNVIAQRFLEKVE
ncbi:MAG: hypothetical protein CL843_18225 [Crocinitomicaceae bacterium]|nr:hypothetical protein [Crocinitomicaceae bacterium]|tara:strand:+ start:701 stop:967 length:267 start_codon:yes stop_codon:yes gene_type:complete